MHTTPLELIYAKKFRLPHRSANIIQGINMVAAFARHAPHVHAALFFSDSIPDRNRYLRECYGVGLDALGDSFCASTRLRGIRYGYWLLKCMHAARNPVVYTRENTELERALLVRRLFRKKIRVVHELHKLGREGGGREDDAFMSLLSRADGLVFIDEGLREDVCARPGCRVPSLVAPSGVNLDAFYSRTIVIPGPTICVGYFGTVTPEKGVFLLAEAFSLLPGTYRLKFVGPVSDDVRAGIVHRAGEAGGRIEFAGYVQPADLPAALADVHISAVPSVSPDKFLSPLKLAESLALGLPMVCTPLEHLKRLVADGEHCVFARDLSPRAFAEALIALGSCPDLMNAMARSNRSHATSFSWDERARRILAFIEGIAD